MTITPFHFQFHYCFHDDYSISILLQCWLATHSRPNDSADMQNIKLVIWLMHLHIERLSTDLVRMDVSRVDMDISVALCIVY